MTQDQIVYPDEDGIVETLYQRAPNTPDFGEIKKRDVHLVMMYGRLRFEQQGAELFKDSPYLGEARTSVEFTVRMAPQRFPIAFPMNTIVGERMHVYGDVWAVDPLGLAAIDKILGNHYGEFIRKEHWCMMHEQNIPNAHFKPSARAWIYLGNPEAWRGVYTTCPPTSSLRYSRGGKREFDIQNQDSWPNSLI